MKKQQYKTMDLTASVFVVVGAINWGLVVLNANVVTWLSNLLNLPIVSKIIYSIVGISGLWVGFRSLNGKFMR